ncbi:MAG: hypothetical protein QOF51_1073 [Chloroflexota bacterium]|jgi:hypothetical protein|nr:hypothetical protein [Chloroflexota bacterium]
MQLKDLLERLSPAELADLLAEYGLELQENADATAVAGLLASYQILGRAFFELDVFQLLILKWLVRQPGYEAPWSKLIDEIGDRVSPEYVVEELHDLRRWGLVDYRASDQRGFVTTFAEVASILPGRAIALADFLPTRSSEELRAMCSAIGFPKPPSLKDERLRAIVRALSDPAYCTALAGNLATPARALFDWIRARAGQVTLAELQRYPGGGAVAGDLAWGGYAAYYTSFYTTRNRKSEPLANLLQLGLVVPIVQIGGWYAIGFAVPEEVRVALEGGSLFDTDALLPPKLEPAEGARGELPNLTTLLRDVGHLLGFVGAGRCEWRQDGEPYARSLQALGKALRNPDKAYPALLWSLCVSAGLLERSRRAGEQFIPIDVVEASPPALFDRLIDGWASTAPPATQNPDMVGIIILRRLQALQLLGNLPPDTWVTKDSVEQYLHFQRPLLFPAPGPKSSGVTSAIEWPALRRLILAEGETPNGTAAVLVPEATQRLLADPATDQLDGLLPWEDTWVVQPDRSVIVPPNIHPQALLDLWGAAELEENQGASIFRLSGTSIAAALNRGIPADDLKQLLAKRSRTPIPATVERLIDDQGQRYGRIRLGPAQTYVRTDDPALLDELEHSRKLGALQLVRLAPDVAIIDGVAPSLALETLRKAGYLPVLDRGAKPVGGNGPVPGSPAFVRRLSNFFMQLMSQGEHASVMWSTGQQSRHAIVEPLDVWEGQLYARDANTGKNLTISLEMIADAVVADEVEAAR